MKKQPRLLILISLMVVFIVFSADLAAGKKSATNVGLRKIISLNGIWEIAQGSMDTVPRQFGRRVAVPGLVDMAVPAFDEVGVKSDKREAFWYRRTFTVDGDVPQIAMLKIHKAKYGTRVFLNGKLIGEHLPCFTPVEFDVAGELKGCGAENELIVRLGADRESVTKTISSGFDAEKTVYIPGIYDSVELILTGSPYIVRVQTAAEIIKQTVRVQALLRNVGPTTEGQIKFKVREVKTGKIVGVISKNYTLDKSTAQTIDVKIPIKNCRLWSPENPFLYELETSTGADTKLDRFGMRSFRFNEKTGKGLLNGKTYFMRGTNVCIFRFFEDPPRRDKPWDKEWVRKLHRKFKSMHWNSIRYCIGFPPEIWYEVADEEGLLIQDEFPLWNGPPLKKDPLVIEYTEWMQERWNHPCVVIWDAQNETIERHGTGIATAEAIRVVRNLDLSDRPWDNGEGQPGRPTDCYESHPYLFNVALYDLPPFHLSEMATLAKFPKGNRTLDPRYYHVMDNRPVIINEYGWLWLNRDGTPTALTKKTWDRILGADPAPTVSQRREAYARYLAALTEFWRCNRKVAAVMHFCGLAYSRPNGYTSDNFLDLDSLEFEPNFKKYVRDAFSPVGLMIDEWARQMQPGMMRQLRVTVINDLAKQWKGTVRLFIMHGDDLIWEQSKPCTVEPFGDKIISFNTATPTKPGNYRLIAELLTKGAQPVRSLRDFEIIKQGVKIRK